MIKNRTSSIESDYVLEQGQKTLYKANAVPALISLLKTEESFDILKEYASGAICALTQDDGKASSHHPVRKLYG
jgi:hypothetical protein